MAELEPGSSRGAGRTGTEVSRPRAVRWERENGVARGRRTKGRGRSLSARHRNGEMERAHQAASRDDRRVEKLGGGRSAGARIKRRTGRLGGPAVEEDRDE
jgi:hypothetical protein